LARSDRSLFGGACVGLLALTAGLATSSPASAFRPNLAYGHRGIAQRALNRFIFEDPEAGMRLGFTAAARDQVVLADEETDILNAAKALECFLDVSADERRLPPFFVSPFHCDDDKLGECSRVVREGLDTVITTVMSGNVTKARACLGRIMHTVQDFHAHSSLVWKLFQGNMTFYQPPLSDDIGRAEREALFTGGLPMSSQVIGSAYGTDVCTGSVERIEVLTPAIFDMPTFGPPLTYQQYTGHVQTRNNIAQFPLVSGYFPDFASVTIPGTGGFPLPNLFEAWKVIASRWEPPRRRCGHGVVTPPDIGAGAGVVLAPGMAKDDLNQPERWQHDAAKELAETASLKLIEAVRDEVQNRLGINPLAYSDTMRKFLGQPQLARAPLGSLGAAIDLSKSMEPVLEGIRDSVNRFAEQAIMDSSMETASTASLVLVGYSDPDIGSPIVGQDPQAFSASLNQLQIGQLGNGGDCPERTIAALESVVDALPEGARAFAFTNSSSKDADRTSALIAAAQAKNITVDINVSGSCSPIDPNFRRITEATGGQLLQTEHDDSIGPGQLMDVELENLAAGRQQLIARISQTAAATERIEFPVDSSISRLTVSIDLSGTEIVDAATASKGVLTLTDPNGQSVAARVEGLVGNVYTVEGPPAGIWSMNVAEATGQPFTLVVRGASPLELSDVSFAEEQGRIGHTAVMRTDQRPIPEEPTALMAHFEEAGASDLDFRLLTLEGATLGSFDVAPDPDLSGLIGTVVPPREPFRIAVTGKRADGTPFQRVNPEVFNTSPYRILPMEDRSMFVPGRRHTLTFQVFNAGGDQTLELRASSTVDAEITVEPEEFALATGELRSVTVSLLLPDELPGVQSVRVTARLGVSADDPNESLASTVRLVSDDRDGDGVADVYEDGPLGEDPTYDGNADGTPDEAQRSVLSLPLFSSEYATLAAANGAEVSELRQEFLPFDAALPPDAMIPLGAFLLSARVGTSYTRAFDLHIGGAADYRLNRLFLAPNGEGEPRAWRPEGSYDAKSRTLHVELEEGSDIDLDPRAGRLSVLAAPGFSLGEPTSEEQSGCICRMPSAGGRPGSSAAWVGLGCLAVVLRRRRAHLGRPAEGTAPF